MDILEKVKTFLDKVSNVSIGYSEINFSAPEKLEAEQVGYRVDKEGNSLANGGEGDWQKEWLVIARDNMGDPIFVDLSSENGEVLTAAHGEGEWEAYPIADSLENFTEIIRKLNELSVNRTHPADLEKNPISKKERKQFLKEIEGRNPNSEVEYWDILLEE